MREREWVRVRTTSKLGSYTVRYLDRSKLWGCESLPILSIYRRILARVQRHVAWIFDGSTRYSGRDSATHSTRQHQGSSRHDSRVVAIEYSFGCGYLWSIDDRSCKSRWTNAIGLDRTCSSMYLSIHLHNSINISRSRLLINDIDSSSFLSATRNTDTSTTCNHKLLSRDRYISFIYLSYRLLTWLIHWLIRLVDRRQWNVYPIGSRATRSTQTAWTYCPTWTDDCQEAQKERASWQSKEDVSHHVVICELEGSKRPQWMGDREWASWTVASSPSISIIIIIIIIISFESIYPSSLSVPKTLPLYKSYNHWHKLCMLIVIGSIFLMISIGTLNHSHSLTQSMTWKKRKNSTKWRLFNVCNYECRK